MRSPLRRTFLLIVGSALLFTLGTFALPINGYIRYSQFGGTIYANLGWIYERIHFDPAPIDVAVLGSSRTMLAVSAPTLEAGLVARGINAKVVNFSVVGNGRNINAMIADELLSVKNPRLLILEVDETSYRYGHPAYQFSAPTVDILKQPIGLHDQVFNLLHLPYRNVRLFFASFFPKAFGFSTTFNRQKYRGSSPETAHSFEVVPGRYIEMNKQIPLSKLISGARTSEKNKTSSRLPKIIANRVYGDDRIYTEEIVNAARAHGVQVAFLFIPYFSGPTTIVDHDFYAARGTVLNAGALAAQDTQYQGWAHLNRAGALRLTRWLADEVALLLEPKYELTASGRGIAHASSKPPKSAISASPFVFGTAL